MSKQTLIEQLFDKIQASGIVNLETIIDEMNKRMREYTTTIKITEARISSGGSLIPKIPTIDIPNPAEIRQYINTQIDNLKRKQQETQIATQLKAATEAARPFTLRIKLLNNDVDARRYIPTRTN